LQLQITVKLRHIDRHFVIDGNPKARSTRSTITACVKLKLKSDSKPIIINVFSLSFCFAGEFSSASVSVSASVQLACNSKFDN